MKRYAIIGAGGFGREMMPIAQQQLRDLLDRGDGELLFVVENAPEPTSVNGHRLLSMEGFKALTGELFFNVAIANSDVRERISNECIRHGMVPFQIASANSVMLDCNEVGEGGIFAPFSMVTSNAKIGRFFHANYYSCVAHDCIVGDFVTFAPGAKCNGNVIIEDHAYIGANAVIKQGTRSNPTVIGRGALVGMGAVVTKSVAPHTTVVGNPARAMRK